MIFDCDGTLADSLPPHVAFCRAMNEELGAGLRLPETSDRDGCRRLAAAPMDNFLRRAGFAESDVETAVQRYERRFAKEFPVGLFPGISAMLRQLLQAHGQGLRLAIVSSNTSRNVRACLASDIGEQHLECPPTDCFDFIWGIDNAARSKAESLTQAAAKLDLAPGQIVYIGDTEKDARCAQACGMHFIGADWGGFEDMGQLAVAASAGSVEGLAPFVALQSPVQVCEEVLRLIQNRPAIAPMPKMPLQSSHAVEQSCTKLHPDAIAPYDAASWWSFITFSWMTPLYDRKGEDLKAVVDTDTAFANWATPSRDAPEDQATRLQQAWNDGGEKPRLLDAFWMIYGRWWLQIASLKLVGMLSVVGTPLLIKAFLGQLPLHTSSSSDTASTEERWPFWVLLALVPMMTLCSFLYTFMWHQ